MRISLIRRTSFVLAMSIGSVSLALPAFPGAEGFGANAVGGRGGDVYHVTTLDADINHLIPGSLTYGLYTKNVPAAGRTIVFDVGGVIDCSAGTITFKDVHNVTIAGQTAPNPGITIIGNTFGVTGNTDANPTHDIIVRYLTVRKGTGAGDDGMHVQGTANTHDVILDHISGSWSEDEVISATQTATNVTVQNSTMFEALTSGHQYGSLIRPTVNSNISYLHNMYANDASRNPRPGTYNGMTLNFEFQNNVIYNYSDRAGYIVGADTDTQHLNMNYVGNYVVPGPSTVDSGNPARRETAFFKETSSTSPLDIHVWQENNKIDSNANTIRDGADTGWNMFHTLNGSAVGPFPEADKVASRFAFPVDMPDSADVAYAKAIATVGNLPWARDATDTRIINNVLNYTGTAPLTAPNITEWNNLTTLSQPANWTHRPANWDTDGDGMPNYWEAIRGTNPNVADNNGSLAGNGYTNLENYLNALSFTANWNADADSSTSAIANWRGVLPQSNYAIVTFGSAITAPRTLTIDTPLTMGDLTFDNLNSYTLAGPGMLTLDALSGVTTVTVVSGSHTIAAPVTLNRDLQLTVTPAASTLAFTGALSATGRTITKLGAGAAQFENVRAAALNVNGGAVKISAKLASNDPAGTSVVQSLSVGGGSTLDLSNNSMVIDYTGGSPLATIRQLLASGYGSGDWTGTGITSSSAAAVAASAGSHRTAIGFADDQSQNSLLMKYVLAGDSNLDDAVDTVDFNNLASAFGSSGTWTTGDFNYDGQVDSVDFNLLAANFGQSMSATADTPGVLIPEPSSLLVLMLVSMLVRRR